MPRKKIERVVPTCTPDEFAEVRSFFGFNDAAAARIRRVLVDGEPTRRVAEEEAIYPQLLYRQCARVQSKVQELRNARPAKTIVPDGWEAATLVAPIPFMEDTRRRLAEYLKNSGAGVGEAKWS